MTIESSCSKTENIGLTRSLNRGILAAKGVYIARQDADDLSRGDRLLQQINFLERSPNHVGVGSQSTAIDPDGTPLYPIDRPLDDGAIRAFLERDNCITHGTALMRRDALLDIGLYDETLEFAQDYDLFLRLSKIGKLENLSERLYLWRRHDESISQRVPAAQRYYVKKAQDRVGDVGIGDA